MKLEILDKFGKVRNGKNNYEDYTQPLKSQGTDFCYIATQNFQFNDHDVIKVTTDFPDQYLVVKLDETIDSSLVYIPNKQWIYEVDLSDNALEIHPNTAFLSKQHYIYIRTATETEKNMYRNLALNPHDQKKFSGAYPHAFANVETRDDATFFACNAINGMLANNLHGSYPYQSWGINRQDDAELTIEFGRSVLINKIGIVLRADFPHDSYWSQITMEFSDNSSEILNLTKTAHLQLFGLQKEHVVNSVTIKNLKKVDDSSPFPALTEIEVYGKNA